MRLTYVKIIFYILEKILFSKIYHMLGLTGTLWYAVFVYLYFCIRRLIHTWEYYSFLIPLNNPLFKNIPHVGGFWHFVICCTCVFVYFVFVFLYLCIQHMWIQFLISFNNPLCKKYTTCWVFLALCLMLYSCVCEFVLVYLYVRHMEI